MERWYGRTRPLGNLSSLIRLLEIHDVHWVLGEAMRVYPDELWPSEAERVTRKPKFRLGLVTRLRYAPGPFLWNG